MPKGQENTQTKNERSGKSWIIKIARVFEGIIYLMTMLAAFVILRVLTEYNDGHIGIAYGTFLGVAALVGAMLLGWFIGRWYSKRPAVNKAVVAVIGFSNLLVWLLPPLGFLVFSLTLQLVINNKASGWYRFLYLTNFILSVGNAYLGFLRSLPS